MDFFKNISLNVNFIDPFIKVSILFNSRSETLYYETDLSLCTQKGGEKEYPHLFWGFDRFLLHILKRRMSQ